ncbi:MAG: hypothetical protein ABI905_06070 [Betaproteobacteria bacterium]
MTNHFHAGQSRFPREQRGVVLFISLIILVAMSLAGVALVRSVDVNVLLAGNLAFRQGATMAAESAVEAARQRISVNGLASTWYNDVASDGYRATWQTGVELRDPFGPYWSNAVTMATDTAGYTASYVIHRMCSVSGDPSSIACVKAGASGTAGSSYGAVSYSNYALQLQGQNPIYRVTVKVVGPKNTLSFVQVVINP